MISKEKSNGKLDQKTVSRIAAAYLETDRRRQPDVQYFAWVVARHLQKRRRHGDGNVAGRMVSVAGHRGAGKYLFSDEI